MLISVAFSRVFGARGCVLAFLAMVCAACAALGCTADSYGVAASAAQEGKPSLNLAFNGPGPSTIAVGTQNVPALCFTAEAKNATMDIRILRAFILDGAVSPRGGLVNAFPPASPNFTNIKFMDMNQDVVVAGPRGVDVTGGDSVQPLDFINTLSLYPDQPLSLCALLDVAMNKYLARNTVQIQLGSPQPGDVVVVASGADLPIADIHPNTGIVRFRTEHPVGWAVAPPQRHQDVLQAYAVAVLPYEPRLMTRLFSFYAADRGGT